MGKEPPGIGFLRKINSRCWLNCSGSGKGNGIAKLFKSAYVMALEFLLIQRIKVSCAKVCVAAPITHNVIDDN